LNSITIVTATLNAGLYLPDLIKSINNQTDLNFNWVIQDGGSVDETIALISGSGVSNIDLVVSQDFSIYDALNKAVQRVKTDYYLVVGADDTLSHDAIELFKYHSATFPALVAAGVNSNGSTLVPGTRSSWLYGMSGIASSHSVGILIRTNLHKKYGYYSNRFPIVADQYFIKTVINNGEEIVRSNFIAGTYGSDGFSGKSLLQFNFEFALMQMRTEKFPALQFILFLIRICKNWK
jgi:glycosyltransferase involved in cell wall biosynthesis